MWNNDPEWLRGTDVPIIVNGRFCLAQALLHYYGQPTTVSYRDLEEGVFKTAVLEQIRPASPTEVKEAIQKFGPLRDVETPCAPCKAGEHGDCVDAGCDSAAELVCVCKECDRFLRANTFALRSDGTWQHDPDW